MRRITSIVTIITLIVGTCGCGDKFVAGDLPTATEQSPELPEALLGTSTIDTEGAHLKVCLITDTMEARRYGSQPWTLDLPVPSGTRVFDGVIVKHTVLDKEVFLTCGCDEVSGKGEVAWWPETAAGASPLQGKQSLFLGDVGSVFRSLVVRDGCLLVLDAANKKVMRLTDSNGDGLWDDASTTLFADSTMFGAETPLTLNVGDEYTSDNLVRVGTMSIEREVARADVRRVYLVDANHDGVAEQLLIEEAVPNVWNPIVEHELVAGLAEMAISVTSGAQYRVQAGATLLASGTAPDQEDSFVIGLSRPLLVSEVVVIQDDTNVLDSGDITVGPTTPVVVWHAVEALGGTTFTGWRLTLHGVDLSVALLLYLTDGVIDVAEGSNPPSLVVAAGANGALEVTLPDTYETGAYDLTLTETGETVAVVPVILENPAD